MNRRTFFLLAILACLPYTEASFAQEAATIDNETNLAEEDTNNLEAQYRKALIQIIGGAALMVVGGVGCWKSANNRWLDGVLQAMAQGNPSDIFYNTLSQDERHRFMSMTMGPMGGWNFEFDEGGQTTRSTLDDVAQRVELTWTEKHGFQWGGIACGVTGLLLLGKGIWNLVQQPQSKPEATINSLDVEPISS